MEALLEGYEEKMFGSLKKKQKKDIISLWWIRGNTQALWKLII